MLCYSKLIANSCLIDNILFTIWIYFLVSMTLSSQYHSYVLLEEDAEVKDPINVMSWYCKFCKVCKACGNNCRSRYFRMACGQCKYCRWSFYRNLIRRIRIRLPRIRLRRIRLRRVRLPRIRLRRIRLRRVRLPRIRLRRVRLPRVRLRRVRLRRVRLPRIRLRRVRLPRVRVPRVRWGRRLRRWG